METARQNYFHFHTRWPSKLAPLQLVLRQSLTRGGPPISPAFRLPHSMLADQADLPILAGDEDVTDAWFPGPRALAVYQWPISTRPPSAFRSPSPPLRPVLYVQRAGVTGKKPLHEENNTEAVVFS